MVIDGNRLLRDLRLAYCDIAKLRNMRLGDSYILYDFYQPTSSDVLGLSNFAAIERVKGGFSLSATWLLLIGHFIKRGYIIIPDFRIKLLRHRQFEVPTQSDYKSLRVFIRLVRLTHRLADMANAAGEKEASVIMRPHISQYHSLKHTGQIVPFLNTLMKRNT